MKKLFAMFLALTMTFQLITPAWADAATEEPEEITEETEVVEEVEEPEEEVPEEETTEATEEKIPQETTEAPTESEEAPTEETVPETTDAEETQPETVEETVGMLAEGVIDSGSCGENVNWVLTKDGTLTISGTGEMSYYYGSDTAPWYKNRKDIVNVVVKSGVTLLSAYAFSGCYKLESAILEEGVKTIAFYAFSDCKKLTSVTLLDGLEDIGSGAFSGCSGLTSVTIPEGVTSIEDFAFSGCSGLTSVALPESVTSIGTCAFENCTSLTGIVIQEGITYIGVNVFKNCTSLTSITIPEGVTSIESYSFLGCTSLINATIPESVTSIGESAFEGCTSLIGIAIPESITYIGGDAFKDCTSLTSITIPEGVTSIEGDSFWGCTSLINVTIPEGVTNIGGLAFCGCTSLISITIPESVTIIGEWAFAGCTSLINATIRKGVLKIEANAFYDCSSLTSITIPESMVSIGAYAFDRCDKLKDVYYSGSAADWNGIAIGDNNEPLRKATKHYGAKGGVEIRPVDLEVLDGGGTVKLSLWSLTQNKAISATWTLTEESREYASISSDGTLKAKAVAEPAQVTVRAVPLNGEPAVQKTIRIVPKATRLLLMQDGVPLGETLEVDLYNTQSLTLTAEKDIGGAAQGLTWKSSNQAVARVDTNGSVTLLKPGTAVIQATDNGKLTGKVTLNVTYTDKSPRLETTTLNLNTALSGGVTVDFVEAYGNGVEALQWDDERFVFEYQENQLTVSAKNPLKNGTYPVALRATCADGREYTYPLTVKVTSTLPKVTVRQTAKLNLFYKDSTAPLVVTAPGQTVTDMELTDTGDFALVSSEDGWKIVYTTQNGKPDTRGTLNIYLEGYRIPLQVNLTVATVTVAPTVKLSAASSTVNSGSELTTRVTLLDKSGNPLEPDNPTVESDDAAVSVNGNLVTITLNEAKSTTVTMYLQDSAWAKPVKLTHKVIVSSKMPTIKLAGNLTLNGLFTARTAETGLVLSQSNLTLDGVDFVSAAKEGSLAWAEAQKLEIGYDGGYVTARIADANNAPRTGTYRFKYTGTLDTGETIPGGTLKVTVSATAPRVKLSASSVKLNKFLAGQEQGTVKVTVPAGYQVVDLEGMREGMFFDEDTGILSVALEDASDNGETRFLYPVVRDVETGEEVTLPTELSFKVQAYNSSKLSVRLSAKGKLDTQKDSEIGYTVTRLTNCLGTVDNMTLEGQDKDLFQAEMDVVNGKPTVHLTLKAGETYATNRVYKVQFRFYVCGQEILSPVQTVKVTQTALKVTAPRTITYYQNQDSSLHCTLTTNVPVDTVALNNDKTSKEFRQAVGDVTLDGNRLELEIANPEALKAGKSYTVYLEATPENNAENVKPVTVKLTVKVRK